ncbi:MAG: type II toxin-antitoxin system VapC family toxin [Methylovulum sp.]|nr:MAG: type II toxin-antitoxin system VapC family toxin [Methylovulum sp.]
MIVLDTHIWVWWLNDKDRYLSAQQIDTIEQAERVAVSVVSCFEVAQIVKKGRLLLPLSVTIACRAVDLTPVHKDPFDRLIIATVLDYFSQLMSIDSNFKHYPELQNHLI